MTERGSLDPTRGTARSSTDAPPSKLAAPMQALVTVAVPSRDRSLPAALCAVAGEVGFDTDVDADPRRASSESAASDRYGGAATLAETAAAVGSAAAGASTETRTALRTYSHTVMTALASQSAAVADDIDPRASAVRVLTDETARRAVADDREPDSSSMPTPTVERCLERARDASAVPPRLRYR